MDSSSPSNTSSTDLEILTGITISAMTTIWDKQPNSFQLRVIPYINAMNHPKNDAQGVLIVQATGGGKSMVYQCSCTIIRGVHLVIQNTLSLSSDQASKIESSNNKYGDVKAIQLDTVSSSAGVKTITSHIQSLGTVSMLEILSYYSRPRNGFENRNGNC